MDSQMQVERSHRRSGFALIELLVVIAGMAEDWLPGLAKAARPPALSSGKVISAIFALLAAVNCARAQAPSAPTGLTATAGNSFVTLTWTAPSGTVTYYTVQRWTTGSATNTMNETAPYTSYTDFAVGAGTNYNYVVNAVNTNGASTNSNQVTSSPTGAASPFVHPGGLHVMADFTRMATNVAAGNHPWIDSYNSMIAESEAQLTWTPDPVGAITRSSDSGNFARCQEDALAIYYLVLEYRITGNTSYANAAITIMDDWSGTCTNISGDSNYALAGGLCGYEFATAAEELHGYSGWSAVSQNAYKSFLVNVFYAANNGFITGHEGTCSSHYRCNWDACNMASMIAIGVFCDETNLFNQAVAYYTNGVGNGCITNAVTFVHPDGLGQWEESGRDQAHTMDGINCEGLVCQVAWNQGVDLYGYDNNMYLRGLEYVCKFNLYNYVPYVHHQTCDLGYDETVVSTADQGVFPYIFEMACAHYVNIKGMAAPYTAQVAALLRPDGGVTDWNSPDWFGFTSLTFYLNPIAATNAATPGGLQASVTGQQATLSWWGSAYATSYNVQRATNSGGPYTTVGTVGSNNLYYVDTGLALGTTYYYVVSANSPGAGSNSAPLAVTPNTLVSGPDDLVCGGITGTAGSYNGNGTTMVNVYDGSTSNFFDGPDATGDWAGLDLGAGVTSVITNVAYCPRNGYASRMQGGEFQGSVSDPTFTTNPVTLFTISAAPAYNVMTSHAINNSTGFRYLRYLGPTDGECDVAEVQFEGNTTGITTPASPTGLTATVSNNSVINLTWAPSAGATSYNIERATISGGPYAIIENLPGTNNSESIPGTNFTDSSFNPLKTNYYVVTALNFAGQSSNSAQATVGVVDTLAATNVLWTGAVSGNWDTTTTNWTTNGVAVTYQNDNPVLFDDTATANTTVSVSAAVTPASVIFNNSLKNYSISGSGIGGTGSLTKLGSGTLTLSGTSANTYSGGTTISNGTLVVGNTSSSPLGTSTLTLGGCTLEDSGSAAVTLNKNITTVAGTTLYLNPTGFDGTGLTLAGNISGPANIIVNGSGSTFDSFALSGNNSGFTGTLTVNSSSDQRFAFGAATAGSPNAAFVFNSAGTDEQKFTFGSGTISFGSMAGGGWLRNDGGATTTLRIGDLNTSTTFSGLMVANGSSAFALLKVGTGTLTLTGADTYTGLTTVFDGELIISTVFAGGGNFVVENGATLGTTNLSTGSAAVASLAPAAGTTLAFLNVSNTSTPLIAATSMTLNGSCTVQIVGKTHLAAGDTYPLINYSGGLTGSFANFQLQMPSGLGGVLVSNTDQLALSVVAFPAIPTGLTATAGNAQVALTWNPSTNATSYNVGRSTASGSGYVTIAGPTTTNYPDTAVTNGTTYYYVVASVNGGNSGTNSAQVSATLVSPVQPPITCGLTNNQLQLGWPASNIGWILQVQTDSPAAGIGTNWVNVPNSTNVNQVSIPIGTTNGSVFFRLVYP